MAKKSNVNIPAIQIIRIIVFLFIGFILFLTYTKTVEFMTTSRLFTVKDVVIDTSIQFIDMAELRRLKGQNIFKVNIVGLQKRIQTQYPQISQLQVIRELPDRIKVLAKKREAIFQVSRAGKFLLVDAEAVAMYYSSTALELPLVQGIGQPKVTLGAPLNTKQANLAAAILKYLKSRPHTAKLKITAMDLSNLSKIQMTLSDVWQVVIDQENYTAKLDMLDVLVAQRKIDFRQVKYIDLRFNEPVLGGN